MNHMNSLNTYVERYKEAKHSIVFVSVFFIFFLIGGNKKEIGTPKLSLLGNFRKVLAQARCDTFLVLREDLL